VIGQAQEEISERSLFRSWPIRVNTLARFGVAYAVLVMVGLGLGWLFTKPMSASRLGRIDTNVLAWLEANRTPFFDSVTRAADSFADTIHVIVAIIVLATAFVWAWRRWRESLVLVFGMTLEALVFLTISLTVGRDRPPVEQMDISPPTASFPSGHTGAAFTLYGILALIVLWNTRRPLPRFLAVAAAVIIPVSVALARVYRGMHYLGDVVVGAGLGIACIFVAVALIDRAIEQHQQGGAT
jgi:membrane-associated phospholipid phosphatase